MVVHVFEIDGGYLSDGMRQNTLWALSTAYGGCFTAASTLRLIASLGDHREWLPELMWILVIHLGFMAEKGGIH